ncbi:MAG: hypothetical protein AAF726_21830 [Planctomycetota bacterium]
MAARLATLGLFALAAPAAAQVTGEWTASNGLLPTEVVPAWSTFPLGSCQGATASLSPTALTIDDATPCPDDALVYSLLTSPLMEPLVDHRVEARMRVVQSTGTDPARGVALLAVAPWSDCPWYIFVDSGEVKLFWGSELLGSAALDATVMRTYRIEANAVTRLSELYVDGQLLISGGVPLPQCSAPSTPRTVVFGNASDVAGGVTEWEFVRHNTGTGDVVYCTEALTPNSRGLIARTDFSGSRSVASNDLVLETDRLPSGSFGYYLCSRAFAAPTPLGGGQGALCLGGPIGRFNRPGEVLAADAGGAVSLAVDLTDVPQPTGAVAVQPGETWHFQYWYRDANPVPTSNTSPGLQLVFE